MYWDGYMQMDERVEHHFHLQVKPNDIGRDPGNDGHGTCGQDETLI